MIITKLIIYLGPDLPSVQNETQAIASIKNPVLESVREPASMSQAIGLAWDRLALSLCVFWVGGVGSREPGTLYFMIPKTSQEPVPGYNNMYMGSDTT